MGKRRLLRGIISGAIVGGLISLFNDDARRYAKDKMCATRDMTSYIVKNPTQSIQAMKRSIETMSSRVSVESKNAINALEQIEETLGKVTKRID